MEPHRAAYWPIRRVNWVAKWGERERWCVARRRRAPLAIVAGLALATGACAESRELGGKAIDWDTHAPIAGVRIGLDCWGDGMWRLEGHDHLRTVIHVTDDEGRYFFASGDLRGCTLLMFSAAKPGYSQAFARGSNNELWGPDKIEIPALMVMIKESDRVIAELPGLMPNPESHITRQNGERLYVDEFKHAYEYFLEAKGIATSEREISFVREHGCGPIQEIHDRVPAADLKEIAGEEVKYSYGANTPRSQSGHARIGDYSEEVRAFCEAKPVQ